MNRLLSITTAAALALTAQSTLAAPIDYSFELDAFFSVGNLSTLTPVSIVISGSGDTDNIFSIDATRIANEFNGTFAYGSVSFAFTEPVYVVRAGGTLALAADISGLSVNTVMSGNIVPISYGLDTDQMFALTPALTFGSFDTDGGLLTINNFGPNTTTNFTSKLGTVPSTVPLPAASLLLLSAIGGLGALSRARKVKT